MHRYASIEGNKLNLPKNRNAIRNGISVRGTIQLRLDMGPSTVGPKSMIKERK